MLIKTYFQYQLPDYRLCMIISFLLFVTNCTKPWEEMDHVYYQDDLHIDGLADITEAERILKAGYNAIDGDVCIEGYFDPSNLSFFKNIYEITGTLTLLGFPPVEVFKRLVSLGTLEIYETDTINDFQDLRSCNEIFFYDCDIRYFSGFDELEEINKFKYETNEVAVERFAAFQNINTAGELSLQLKQDPNKAFEGFTNLTQCNHLITDSIGHSAFQKLEKISGSFMILHTVGQYSFSSLNKAKSAWFYNISNREISLFRDSLVCEFFIIDCSDSLTSFEKSPVLVSIDAVEVNGCGSIISLDGLKLDNQLDFLYITGNKRLYDYCAIVGVEAERYSIIGNKYNPTLQEINSGKCKP